MAQLKIFVKPFQDTCEGVARLSARAATKLKLNLLNKLY